MAHELTDWHEEAERLRVERDALTARLVERDAEIAALRKRDKKLAGLLREALDTPSTRERYEDTGDTPLIRITTCEHCGQPLYKEVVYPYLQTTRLGDHARDCWMNRATAALAARAARGEASDES
jgi:hypothetical protein